MSIKDNTDCHGEDRTRGRSETSIWQEESEDTKGVLIIRKSKRNIQHNGPYENGQKGKQRSTKHYTEY